MTDTAVDSALADQPASLQQLSDFTTGLDAILQYCQQLLQSTPPNSNASTYTPIIHKTQRYFDESLSPIATELQAVVQSLQQSLQANRQVQQQADYHNKHAAHQLLLAQYNVTHRATAELCIPRQPTPVRRIRLRQLKDNELNKALRPKAAYEYSGKVNLDQLKDIGYESTAVHRPPPSPSSIVAPVLSRDDLGLNNDSSTPMEFDRRISLNTDGMRARAHTRQNSLSVNSPALPNEPLSLMNLQGRHRRDLSGSVSSPSSGVTQLISPVNVTSPQRRATLGSQAFQAQTSPVNQQPQQPAPIAEPSRRATMSVMESGTLDSKPKPPSRPLPPELPPIPAAARSPPVVQRQVTPPSIASYQQPEPQRRMSTAPPPPPPPPMPATAPALPVHVAAPLPPPVMPMAQQQHAPPPPPLPVFARQHSQPTSVNAPPPPPPSFSAPPPPPASAPPPSSAPPPPPMPAPAASKAIAKKAAGPADRKDLLASIQAGKGLKKVQRPVENNALAGKVL